MKKERIMQMLLCVVVFIAIPMLVGELLFGYGGRVVFGLAGLVLYIEPFLSLGLRFNILIKSKLVVR